MRYAVILLLAGCVSLTPEQERERFERELDRMIETYGPACQRLGPESSPEWANCVVALHDREQARRQRAAAIMGQALQNFGNTVYGPDAVRARQMPSRRPIQTDCQTYGNTTSCTTQ